MRPGVSQPAVGYSSTRMPVCVQRHRQDKGDGGESDTRYQCLTLVRAPGQHPARVIGGLGGNEVDRSVDGVLGAQDGHWTGVTLNREEGKKKYQLHAVDQRTTSKQNSQDEVATAYH